MCEILSSNHRESTSHLVKLSFISTGVLMLEEFIPFKQCIMLIKKVIEDKNFISIPSMSGTNKVQRFLFQIK